MIWLAISSVSGGQEVLWPWGLVQTVLLKADSVLSNGGSSTLWPPMLIPPNSPPPSLPHAHIQNYHDSLILFFTWSILFAWSLAQQSVIATSRGQIIVSL